MELFDIVEEWWGKQATLAVGFFKAIARDFGSHVTWVVTQDGEEICSGLATSLEHAGDILTTRLQALTDGA